MKIFRFSITATLTCAITIFRIGNTHPLDVKTESPSMNLDSEIVDFAKAVGAELLEIEPSGRTVRKYEKDTLRDSDQTFLCQGQGQVGVPHDCKRYHVCARAGAESGGGVCFGDKLFHHQKRECLKITEAQCHASMCKNITNKFRDPFNRENFLVCTNMVPEVRRCPDGKIYYPQLRSCESGSAMKGLKESFEEEEEKVLAHKNKNETGIGEIRPKNKMGHNKPGQAGMQGNNGPQNFQANNGQFGMQGNNGPQTKNIQPGIQGNNGPQTKNIQPRIQGNNGPQTLEANNGQPGMQGNNDPQTKNMQPGIQGNNGPQTLEANNGQFGTQGNNGPQTKNIQPGMQGNNGPQTYPENNGQGMQDNNGPQTYPANNGQPGMQDNNGRPGQVRMTQSISINKKKRHFKDGESAKDAGEETGGGDEIDENEPGEVDGETVSGEDNGETGGQEENGDIASGQGDGKSVGDQRDRDSVPDPAEVNGDSFRLVLPPPDEEKR